MVIPVSKTQGYPMKKNCNALNYLKTSNITQHAGHVVIHTRTPSLTLKWKIHHSNSFQIRLNKCRLVVEQNENWKLVSFKWKLDQLFPPENQAVELKPVIDELKPWIQSPDDNQKSKILHQGIKSNLNGHIHRNVSRVLPNIHSKMSNWKFLGNENMKEKPNFIPTWLNCM